jgi:hypothetical protein
MKNVRGLILYITSAWCVALPLMAHAETDACTLLTPAQVGAVVGGAVSDGTQVQGCCGDAEPADRGVL